MPNDAALRLVVHQLDEGLLHRVAVAGGEAVDAGVTAGAVDVAGPDLVHQLALDLADLDVARDEKARVQGDAAAAVAVELAAARRVTRASMQSLRAQPVAVPGAQSTRP